MVRFIILSFSILVFSGFTRSEIDFMNKKIQKEIPKIFEIKEFQLTEMKLPESVSDHNSPNGKFFGVTSQNNPIGYAYVGRVNSCRASGCSVSIEPDEVQAYEYFDYFIIYSSDLSIKAVRVFNYQATHGHEITAKSWLKQFNNYKGSEDLIVGKNIDAISGATISTHAITFDIQNKSELLHYLK